MKEQLHSFIAVFVTCLFAGGCGTVFDFSGPNHSTASQFASKPTGTVTYAKNVAKYYIDEYRKRDENLSNIPQVYEVPIIGAAAAAVSTLAFGMDTDIALGLGLGAAGLHELGSYYAPRERAKIYRSGIDAMECLARAADKMQFIDRGAQQLGNKFKAASTLKNAADNFGLARAAVQKQMTNIQFPSGAPKSLTSVQVSQVLALDAALDVTSDLETNTNGAADMLFSGVQSVRTAINNRLREATTAPDYEAIIKRMQARADAEAKRKAAWEDAKNKKSNAGPSTMSNLDLLLSEEANKVQKLQKDIEDCVALAAAE